MLLFSTWLNNSIFVSEWGKERVWTVVLTGCTTVQVFLYFSNRRPYSEPCLHWASFDRQNICSALNPEWEFLLQEHLLMIQKVYLYSEWEPFTSEHVTMSLTFYRKQNPGALGFFFPSFFYAEYEADPDRTGWLLYSDLSQRRFYISINISAAAAFFPLLNISFFVFRLP